MNITLIGTGGVAENLAVALSHQYNVSVVGKSLLALSQLTGYNSRWSACVNYIPELTHVILIAVQDSQVANVIKQIDFSILHDLQVIAHTSGSVGIEVFEQHTDKGAVFYPLQTFSKNRIVSWQNVPIFIEAHSIEVENILFKLASSLEAQPLRADSQKRKYIHLGAVFAQNFFNYLMQVAHEVTQKQGLTHTIYYPLLKETLLKIADTQPIYMQTGPAKRKDLSTIEMHIKMLQKEFPHYETLYRILTDYIIEFSHK